MESSPTLSSSVAARFNDLCLQDIHEAILRHVERLMMSKDGGDDTTWAAFRNSARPLSLDVFFRRQERSEQRDDDGDEDSSVICTAGLATDGSSSVAAATISPKRMRHPQQRVSLDDTHAKKRCLQA
jgi:hypothetical protein